ncbi:hypothetical protein [Rhizobium laguerreae]|uniref:hypothetical protein n=1 Tax=Rhizobium laguerreae TaxID=1076926 RepID=UPI00144149F9|nr:hypothetical protein [Rhizobium laguerreae]NKM36631.1 hypothetical protein [Rhizobium laguerreae]
MLEYYTLKFYRVAFGDTRFKDVSVVADTLAEVKEEACEALYSRFNDMKTAGRGSKAPYTAALLNKNEHVIARFEVRPVVPGSGEKAFEVPPQLWLDRMPGTPSPAVHENLYSSDSPRCSTLSRQSAASAQQR